MARAPGDGQQSDATDERQLVRRAQAGDEAAYEALVRTHQHRVVAIASRLLRGSEDAEDVAQQVFVKAYFSLRRFDHRSKFSTWLYKIAVNECWNHLRKKKARPLVYASDLSEEQSERLEETGQPADTIDPEDAARLHDLVEWLLSHLDEKDRLMLVLKEMQGFSIEEISELLHLNPNTVKVRLFRARGKLVEIYRRRLTQARPAAIKRG
ncbi:MAG TPA: sigma-70 family RNA polymerase sigma factor [Candidatus Acidoferrales bacterium]|nr:sigma-70 family RNA polymerase sigma factor [Candidatus Acidoferrales bacterium]